MSIKSIWSYFAYLGRKSSSEIKDFLKSISFLFNKTTTLIPLVLLLTTIASTCSSICIAKNTKFNRGNSLIEIAQDYRGVYSEIPNGLIYPKKMVSSDVMTYRMPEYATSLRTTHEDFEIFDVYQSDWAGLYSPGVVNISDTEVCKVSFLSLPRKYTYITQEWLYNIPLLYPRSNPLSDFRGATDIFITKERADYLLKKYGRPEGDYAFVCSNDSLSISDRTIPYSWNFGEPGKHDPVLINNLYSIKGVIDTTSEQYLKYREKFGDFFVVNESFSLPIPCVTYFSMKLEDRNDEKLLNTILKTYFYNAAIQNTSVYGHVPLFDYRITFFGNYKSENSILKICVDDSPTTQKTDAVFDAYFNKANILPLLLSIVINVCCLIISSFAFRKIVARQKEKHTFVSLRRGPLILVTGVLVSIAFVLGVLAMKLLNSTPIFSATSFTNIFGFLIAFFEALLISAFFVINTPHVKD